MCPTVTFGSGESIFQLGTMSAVASRNFSAIWFNTWPLYGMPSGKTTSNAEIRSDTTITSKSSLMLYTSRTLPWYTLFCFGKRKSVFVNALLIFILFFRFALFFSNGPVLFLRHVCRTPPRCRAQGDDEQCLFC